jgi:excisionase family DNA binding protein
MTRRQSPDHGSSQRTTVGTGQRLTFTVDEVAAQLGISRSAVYDCIARGEIPAKRLGRRVVVVRAALEAFLAEPDGARRERARRLRRLA